MKSKSMSIDKFHTSDDHASILSVEHLYHKVLDQIKYWNNRFNDLMVAVTFAEAGEFETAKKLENNKE